MRVHTIFISLCIFALSTTAWANKPRQPLDESRGSIYAAVPLLSINWPIKGSVGGVGAFGMGLNYTWRNHLYLGAQAMAWAHFVDDFGKTYDLNLGYSVNLNTDEQAPWLVNVVPQVGYRYARRWYYYRDGFGPENRSHGVLMGVSYEFYQNKPIGFVIRAHTLFEWAPYSVITENGFGDEFDQYVYVTGVDFGLSVGLSFGL